MNKIFKWIGAVFVAMINICLLCGAGHVLVWMKYFFKKTTPHARGTANKITRVALKSLVKNIPALGKRL